MKHSNMEAALRHGSTHCASLPENGDPAAFLPRKHRRGAQPLLAAVMAGLLALTGCTADDDPPETTAGPASASTSPAPGATTAATAKTTAAPIYKPATDLGPAQNVPVPVLPEKAKEFSEEGLIAFTEYWYQTLGYAFETGDPAPMMAITGPSCATCEAIRVAVGPWHSDGRWIVGGQMTVLTTSTSFISVQGNPYEVTALVRQKQLKFYRGNGSLAEDRGQKPSVGDVFTASHVDGQWTAIDVQRLGG